MVELALMSFAYLALAAMNDPHVYGRYGEYEPGWPRYEGGNGFACWRRLNGTEGTNGR